MPGTFKTKKHSLASRLLSTFLSVSMILLNLYEFSPSAYAQAQVFETYQLLPSGSPIQISPELGSVEEFLRGESGKAMIYIQDAHDSLDAQTKIAGLIQSLVHDYGVQTVFEEGYEGRVPTDHYFGSIQDPEIKEKVSYYLLDQLQISGAEYAHINRKKDFKLIGADSIDLHLKNVEWYRENERLKKKTNRDLKRIEKEIRGLSQRLFSKEIREWLDLRDRLDHDKLDLFHYLQRLYLLRPKSDREQTFPEKYPAISVVLNVSKLNDQEAQDYEKRLDGTLLFREIEGLEREVTGNYLKSQKEIDLFEYVAKIKRLQKLTDLGITQAEFQVVRESLSGLTTRRIGQYLAEEKKEALVLSKRWETNIQSAISFYETAYQRDEIAEKKIDEFVQNPDEKMAVMVFGGFHTQNIKEKLRSKGVSYLIVTPKMEAFNLEHENRYKDLMRTVSGFQADDGTVREATPPFRLLEAPRAQLMTQQDLERRIQLLSQVATRGKGEPRFLLHRRLDLVRSELREKSHRFEVSDLIDVTTPFGRQRMVSAYERLNGYASAEELAAELEITTEHVKSPNEAAWRLFQKVDWEQVNREREEQGLFPFYPKLIGAKSKRVWNKILAHIEERGGISTVLEIANDLDLTEWTVYDHVKNIDWDHINRVQVAKGRVPLFVFYRKAPNNTVRRVDQKLGLLGNGLKYLRENGDIYDILKLTESYYYQRLRDAGLPVSGYDSRGFRSYRLYTLPVIYCLFQEQFKRLTSHGGPREQALQFLQDTLRLVIKKMPLDLIPVGSSKRILPRSEILHDYFQVQVPRAVMISVDQFAAFNAEGFEANLNRVLNWDFPLVESIYPVDRIGGDEKPVVNISDYMTVMQTLRETEEGLGFQSVGRAELRKGEFDNDAILEVQQYFQSFYDGASIFTKFQDLYRELSPMQREAFLVYFQYHRQTGNWPANQVVARLLDKSQMITSRYVMEGLLPKARDLGIPYLPWRKVRRQEVSLKMVELDQDDSNQLHNALLGVTRPTDQEIGMASQLFQRAFMKFGTDVLGRAKELYARLSSGERLMFLTLLQAQRQFDFWVGDNVVLYLLKTSGHVPSDYPQTSVQALTHRLAEKINGQGYFQLPSSRITESVHFEDIDLEAFETGFVQLARVFEYRSEVRKTSLIRGKTKDVKRQIFQNLWKAVEIVGWSGALIAAGLCFAFLPAAAIISFLPIFLEGWGIVGFSIIASRYKGQYLKQIAIMAGGVAFLFLAFHVMLPSFIPTLNLSRDVVNVFVSIGISSASVFLGVLLSKFVSGKLFPRLQDNEKWGVLSALKWALGVGIGAGYYLYYMLFPFLRENITGIQVPYLGPETSLATLRFAFDISVAAFTTQVPLAIVLGAAFGENQSLKGDLQSFRKSRMLRSFLSIYPVLFIFWCSVMIPLWFFFPAVTLGFKIIHASVTVLWNGIFRVIVAWIFGSVHIKKDVEWIDGRKKRGRMNPFLSRISYPYPVRHHERRRKPDKAQVPSSESPNRIELLIFDLDGTLHDSPLLEEAYKQSAYRLYQERFGGSLQDAEKMVEARRIRIRGPQRHEGQTEALESFGISYPEIAEYYERLASDVPKYVSPNSVLEKVLESLSQKYYLVVATNAPERIARTVLAALGVSDLIENVYARNQTGFHKPDRRLYELIGKDFRVARDQIVVVGDRDQVDLGPARELGMHGVLVANPDDLAVRLRIEIKQIEAALSQRSEGRTFSKTGKAAIWKTIQVLGWSGAFFAAIASVYFLPFMKTMLAYLPVMAEGWAIIALLIYSSQFRDQNLKQFSVVFLGFAMIFGFFHFGLPVVMPGLEMSFDPNPIKIVSGMLIRFTAIFIGTFLSEYILNRMRAPSKGETVKWKPKSAIRWALGNGVLYGYYLYTVFYPYQANAFQNLSLPFFSPERSISILKTIFDLSFVTFLTHAMLIIVLGAAFGESKNVLNDLKSVTRGWRPFFQSRTIKTFRMFYPANFLFWTIPLSTLWFFFPQPTLSFKLVHGLMTIVHYLFVRSLVVWLFNGEEASEQLVQKGDKSELRGHEIIEADLPQAKVAEIAAFSRRLRQRAEEILRKYPVERRQVRLKKEDNTPVTPADLEIQAAFMRMVLAQYPDHYVWGEERLRGKVVAANEANRRLADHIWIIAPIDGTKGFSRGNYMYGVSIAHYFKGRPVHALIFLPEYRDGVTLEAFQGVPGVYLNGGLSPLVLPRGEKLPGKLKASVSGAKDIADNLRKNIREAVRHALAGKGAGNVGFAHRHRSAIFRTAQMILEDAYVFSAILNYGQGGPKMWDIAATSFLVEKAGGEALVLEQAELKPALEIFHRDILGKPGHKEYYDYAELKPGVVQWVKPIILREVEKDQGRGELRISYVPNAVFGDQGSKGWQEVRPEVETQLLYWQDLLRYAKASEFEFLLFLLDEIKKTAKWIDDYIFEAPEKDVLVDQYQELDKETDALLLDRIVHEPDYFSVERLFKIAIDFGIAENLIYRSVVRRKIGFWPFARKYFRFKRKPLTMFSSLERNVLFPLVAGFLVYSLLQIYDRDWQMGVFLTGTILFAVAAIIPSVLSVYRSRYKSWNRSIQGMLDKLEEINPNTSWPPRMKELEEREARELAVSIYGRLEGISVAQAGRQWSTGNPVEGLGKSYAIESNEITSGKNLGPGSTVMRVGPLIFIRLQEGGSQKLQRRIEAIQRQLGDLYETYAGNILFIQKPDYSNKFVGLASTEAALSPSSLHAVAVMLSQAETIWGGTVGVFGAGNGILAAAALALGARKVFLFDRKERELEKAETILKAQGWREFDGEEGDFVIKKLDLTSSLFSEYVEEEDLPNQIQVGIANIGPWAIYRNANRRVAEEVSQWSGMELFINSGYQGEMTTRLGHEQEARKVQDLFKENGFETHEIINPKNRIIVAVRQTRSELRESKESFPGAGKIDVTSGQNQGSFPDVWKTQVHGVSKGLRSEGRESKGNFPNVRKIQEFRNWLAGIHYLRDPAGDFRLIQKEIRRLEDVPLTQPSPQRGEEEEGARGIDTLSLPEGEGKGEGDELSQLKELFASKLLSELVNHPDTHTANDLLAIALELDLNRLRILQVLNQSPMGYLRFAWRYQRFESSHARGRRVGVFGKLLGLSVSLLSLWFISSAVSYYASPWWALLFLGVFSIVYFQNKIPDWLGPYVYYKYWKESREGMKDRVKAMIGREEKPSRSELHSSPTELHEDIPNQIVTVIGDALNAEDFQIGTLTWVPMMRMISEEGNRSYWDAVSKILRVKDSETFFLGSRFQEPAEIISELDSLLRQAFLAGEIVNQASVAFYHVYTHVAQPDDGTIQAVRDVLVQALDDERDRMVSIATLGLLYWAITEGFNGGLETESFSQNRSIRPVLEKLRAFSPNAGKEELMQAVGMSNGIVTLMESAQVPGKAGHSAEEEKVDSGSSLFAEFVVLISRVLGTAVAQNNYPDIQKKALRVLSDFLALGLMPDESEEWEELVALKTEKTEEVRQRLLLAMNAEDAALLLYLDDLLGEKERNEIFDLVLGELIRSAGKLSGSASVRAGAVQAMEDWFDALKKLIPNEVHQYVFRLQDLLKPNAGSSFPIRVVIAFYLARTFPRMLRNSLDRPERESEISQLLRDGLNSGNEYLAILSVSTLLTLAKYVAKQELRPRSELRKSGSQASKIVERNDRLLAERSELRSKQLDIAQAVELQVQHFAANPAEMFLLNPAKLFQEMAGAFPKGYTGPALATYERRYPEILNALEAEIVNRKLSSGERSRIRTAIDFWWNDHPKKQHLRQELKVESDRLPKISGIDELNQTVFNALRQRDVETAKTVIAEIVARAEKQEMSVLEKSHFIGNLTYLGARLALQGHPEEGLAYANRARDLFLEFPGEQVARKKAVHLINAFDMIAVGYRVGGNYEKAGLALQEARKLLAAYAPEVLSDHHFHLERNDRESQILRDLRIRHEVSDGAASAGYLSVAENILTEFLEVYPLYSGIEAADVYLVRSIEGLNRLGIKFSTVDDSLRVIEKSFGALEQYAETYPAILDEVKWIFGTALNLVKRYSNQAEDPVRSRLFSVPSKIVASTVYRKFLAPGSVSRLQALASRAGVEIEVIAGEDSPDDLTQDVVSGPKPDDLRELEAKVQALEEEVRQHPEAVEKVSELIGELIRLTIRLASASKLERAKETVSRAREVLWGQENFVIRRRALDVIKAGSILGLTYQNNGKIQETADTYGMVLELVRRYENEIHENPWEKEGKNSHMAYAVRGHHNLAKALIDRGQAGDDRRAEEILTSILFVFNAFPELEDLKGQLKWVMGNFQRLALAFPDLGDSIRNLERSMELLRQHAEKVRVVREQSPWLYSAVLRIIHRHRLLGRQELEPLFQMAEEIASNPLLKEYLRREDISWHADLKRFMPFAEPVPQNPVPPVSDKPINWDAYTQGDDQDRPADAKSRILDLLEQAKDLSKNSLPMDAARAYDEARALFDQNPDRPNVLRLALSLAGMALYISLGFKDYQNMHMMLKYYDQAKALFDVHPTKAIIRGKLFQMIRSQVLLNAALGAEMDEKGYDPRLNQKSREIREDARVLFRKHHDFIFGSLRGEKSEVEWCIGYILNGILTTLDEFMISMREEEVLNLFSLAYGIEERFGRTGKIRPKEWKKFEYVLAKAEGLRFDLSSVNPREKRLARERAAVDVEVGETEETGDMFQDESRNMPLPQNTRAARAFVEREKHKTTDMMSGQPGKGAGKGKWVGEDKGKMGIDERVAQLRGAVGKDINGSNRDEVMRFLDILGPKYLKSLRRGSMSPANQEYVGKIIAGYGWKSSERSELRKQPDNDHSLVEFDVANFRRRQQEGMKAKLRQAGYQPPADDFSVEQILEDLLSMYKPVVVDFADGHPEVIPESVLNPDEIKILSRRIREIKNIYPKLSKKSRAILLYPSILAVLLGVKPAYLANRKLLGLKAAREPGLFEMIHWEAYLKSVLNPGKRTAGDYSSPLAQKKLEEAGFKIDEPDVLPLLRELVRLDEDSRKWLEASYRAPYLFSPTHFGQRIVREGDFLVQRGILRPEDRALVESIRRYHETGQFQEEWRQSVQLFEVLLSREFSELQTRVFEGFVLGYPLEDISNYENVGITQMLPKEVYIPLMTLYTGILAHPRGHHQGPMREWLEVIARVLDYAYVQFKDLDGFKKIAQKWELPDPYRNRSELRARRQAEDRQPEEKQISSLTLTLSPQEREQGEGQTRSDTRQQTSAQRSEEIHPASSIPARQTAGGQHPASLDVTELLETHQNTGTLTVSRTELDRLTPKQFETLFVAAYTQPKIRFIVYDDTNQSFNAQVSQFMALKNVTVTGDRFDEAVQKYSVPKRKIVSLLKDQKAQDYVRLLNDDLKERVRFVRIEGGGELIFLALLYVISDELPFVTEVNFYLEDPNRVYLGALLDSYLADQMIFWSA
ncbi:MAG: HAD hydrolase-like protein [Candidatus Omnitrophica bacterium]|nr:HAD hydrolase-like protein [Candidatus Omnitrophota bacterium]